MFPIFIFPNERSEDIVNSGPIALLRRLFSRFLGVKKSDIDTNNNAIGHTKLRILRAVFMNPPAAKRSVAERRRHKEKSDLTAC